jgi:hypothetical protein
MDINDINDLDSKLVVLEDFVFSEKPFNKC